MTHHTKTKKNTHTLNIKHNNPKKTSNKDRKINLAFILYEIKQKPGGNSPLLMMKGQHTAAAAAGPFSLVLFTHRIYSCAKEKTKVGIGLLASVNVYIQEEFNTVYRHMEWIYDNAAGEAAACGIVC